MRYSGDHGVAVLTHLLGAVALLPDHSPIRMAFKEEEIVTVGDLLTLTEEDIITLQYTGKEGRAGLNRGERGMVRSLIAYIRRLQENPMFDIYVDYPMIKPTGFAYF
jgi:hypothetical protein